MKPIVLSLIFVLAFTFYAQDSDQLANTVDDLFSLSKNKEYNAICGLIVFTGEDQSREYKSSLNPQSKAELEQAKRIAKKIKAYIDISDSYEILRSSSETVEEAEIHTLIVGFKSGNQQLEIPFKFIKIDDKYLLIEID